MRIPITFKKQTILSHIKALACTEKDRLKAEDITWFLRSLLKAGYLLFKHDVSGMVDDIALRVGGESTCCLSFEGKFFWLGHEENLPSTAMITSPWLARSVYGRSEQNVMLKDVRVPVHFFARRNLPKYLIYPILRDFAAEGLSENMRIFRDIL